MTPLDTSGAVPILNSGGQVRRGYLWPDLSQFAQGYVEALLTHVGTLYAIQRSSGKITGPGFSDLAPEALAMILRDCTRGRCALPTSHAGGSMWSNRQKGRLGHFPPLRVYLNDAGKVMLEEIR